MITAVIHKLVDFFVTSLLWVYFIFGFLLIFTPYLGWISIRNKSGETSYQRMFHYFFRIFFKLVLFFSPLLTIRIDPKIRTIRSSVVVGNHLSYLDPLLFISVFEKHKTIVKNSFYKVPVFGWLIKQSGYVPSAANGKYMAQVVCHIGAMKEYLASGGTLFVFPEGTRSRDGKPNEFNKGAFSIARQCQAPVSVVYIKNANRLFKRGSWLFNTCQPNTIDLELLGTINPFDSPEQMAEKAKKMIEVRINHEQKMV